MKIKKPINLKYLESKFDEMQKILDEIKASAKQDIPIKKKKVKFKEDLF